MQTVADIKRELARTLDPSENVDCTAECTVNLIEQLIRAILQEELTLRGLVDRPWKPGDPVHKPHGGYGFPVWPPNEGDDERP